MAKKALLKLLEEAHKLLEEAHTIILLTHQNPDIDGLSCMLSFKLLFPQKRVFPIVEKIPENASFLHGYQSLIKPEVVPDSLEVDLIVLFDASCERRIDERIKAKIKQTRSAIVFDHHQKEDCESLFQGKTYWIVDPQEASTSSLFYRFLKRAKIPLTPQVAENLLAGIYYDTGSFRYENVRGDLFKVAYDLMKLGARPSYIAQTLYENIPLSQVKFLKLVLERVEFLKDGAFALSYLTWEDFQRLGGEESLNDLAGYLRSIKGVILSALVKEVGKNLIKVSLRSKAPFEALRIARIFNGGGHKYACGFSIEGISLSEFLKTFKKTLESLP
ncbi:MAG: bifunctional oligoribonuclease/PAP phosphatase NrnA [Caldimicrobium sp.]|nr:bifunctional oligoribonuclease/PAP phosphatase NrnA [Caldimicrobium sp.]MCX7874404.1 bifunctional oligoribonuclease/PAP phosphatase NrnA [Caldimicrobium sp.]MDW8094011.1 bifunctional oligoribonuclease/PAP phosphatase NrnA [Caldimicrobium sp.]